MCIPIYIYIYIYMFKKHSRCRMQAKPSHCSGVGDGAQGLCI